MKKHFYLVLLLFNFILAQAQTWQNKVHETVFKNIGEKNLADIIVYFKQQADLSGADILETKEEKGAFVFQKLTATAEQSQGRVVAFLENKHFTFQKFWIVNSVALKADMATIEALARFDEVEKIVNNPTTRHTLPSINALNAEDFSSSQTTICLPPDTLIKSYGYARIKADSVWGLGFRGQGVVVGGEDTGYEWTHPALIKKYRGYNGGMPVHDYNWHDAIHADTSKKGNPCGYDVKIPCDDNNHGTHTMGSMVGGTIGTNKDTVIIGVAPDAQWIGARNMDVGNGTLTSYAECFQWFIAPTNTQNLLPDTKKAPHVINNSWYCAPEEGCNASNFDILEKSMNAVRSAGIVVVVSNGNAGPNCATTSGPPAFFTKAFSIGATDSKDTIANFSSRGAVIIDNSNRLKPSVCAPGVVILSSVKGGGYATNSGTSMSGPHVVGLVALMISANPKLAGQVDTIQRIIETTALQLKTSENCGGVSGQTIPNNTYGYGRVDALAAVKKALQYKSTPTQDIKPAMVNIFPNPFLNEFNISATGIVGDVNVQVFNTIGQIVYTQKNNFILNPIITISLPQTPAGLYFYRIENEKTQLTGKIVK